MIVAINEVVHKRWLSMTLGSMFYYAIALVINYLIQMVTYQCFTKIEK